MTRIERRGSPRVAHRLPLTIHHGIGEVVIQTKNLSSSGAYCTLRRFLAPMTKLQIRLAIPGSPHHTPISCRGVIVRTEPAKARPRCRRYHVAIFFHELADHDRSVLARYVQHHLHRASVHR